MMSKKSHFIKAYEWDVSSSQLSIDRTETSSDISNTISPIMCSIVSPAGGPAMAAAVMGQ